MAKTITFNTASEEVTLTVQNVSSAVYNAIKNTLRITIAEADHSWDDIKKLADNIGEITYADDGATQFVYNGFELPSNGLIGGIKEGIWTVEIEQKNALAEEVSANSEAIGELLTVIGSLMGEEGE